MDDKELIQQLNSLREEADQLEMTNVYDLVSGEPFTWVELWVLYGVDRV